MNDASPFRLALGRALTHSLFHLDNLEHSPVAATATFDHRRMYLDYEGPVSGKRGRVLRWDHGTFSWQKNEDDHLAVELNGVRLHGSVVLKRAGAEEWTLSFG